MHHKLDSDTEMIFWSGNTANVLMDWKSNKTSKKSAQSRHAKCVHTQQKITPGWTKSTLSALAAYYMISRGHSFFSILTYLFSQDTIFTYFLYSEILTEHSTLNHSKLSTYCVWNMSIHTRYILSKQHTHCLIWWTTGPLQCIYQTTKLSVKCYGSIFFLHILLE